MFGGVRVVRKPDLSSRVTAFAVICSRNGEKRESGVGGETGPYFGVHEQCRNFRSK
jgi:hypothetical protein